MRVTALAMAATLACGGAMAQGAPVGAGGAAASPAQQAFQERIRSEREGCRAQVMAGRPQGAGGQPDQAVRDAVMACMARIEPMAARRMACVQEARGKGVSGPDAMRPYVQSCMARHG